MLRYVDMSQEIEEIKAKVDLIDFIGSYIKLTPAGVNYKAPCPFHNEKTPSFMANKAKQIWKCFGCNEGGDIFTFLMKIEGLEFPEALKILAQRAGVTLSRSNPEVSSKKNRLHDLTDLTARYWHKILLESSQAEKVREYLKQRNVSDDAIEDFKIGYAVESWDNLIDFLTKKGFGIEEVFSAGLAVRKEKGSGFYDRFRNRLMFPILDLSGQADGFGGRILFTEEGAKYINTPQTEIYNKSLILYGLYQAKEAIRRQDSCILVEGYMDVIPLHQAGFKNAVAISGTALTLEQIRILKRYTDNLVIALDMDAAGRMAAERSIDLALSEEMNVKAIRLPHGKDPGECVAKSPEDFRRALTEAQPVMDYFFDETFNKYDSSLPENKKMIAKILLNKIVRLGNLIERDFWLKELAFKLNVSETVLRE
ncbi:MAG: DNA primase, partial [Patescibacteria group bacterium]